MFCDRRPTHPNGFSLLEVVIVMLIIGTLAAVAIPRFVVYQYRTKSAEAKINLSSIRVAEEAYYSENETYVSVAPEPPVLPGGLATVFDGKTSGFSELGFDTEGNVFFSYGVAVSTDRTGYTIDAGSDIDEDGIVQLWGYTKPDALGARPAGQVGCNPTGLSPLVISPCDPDAGTSIF